MKHSFVRFLIGILFLSKIQGAEVQLSIPGAVKVVIEPAEAVQEGALFQIDSGVFQPAGASVGNLDAGLHSVLFKDLPGWIEPQTEPVLVVGGHESLIRAVYRPLPRFYFRDVPDQRVRSGTVLEFKVHTDNSEDPQNPGAGAQLQLTAQPNPSGALSFDAASGIIRYQPAPSDRLPFYIALSFPNGLVGKFEITPLNSLTVEDSVLEYDRPMPDETSRDYIQISEVRQPAEVFNDVTTPTSIVSVSGHTLVFDKDHPAGIHRQFNDRTTLKQFNLYADRVIIRTPLFLPQTIVQIHARELRFEGEGRIDTTPRPRNTKPAGAVWGDGLTVGNPGYAGHPGGDIRVYVERFYSDATSSTRFVMRGGLGGEAGQGRKGRSEAELETGSDDWKLLMKNAGNSVCRVMNPDKIILSIEERLNDRVTGTCGVKAPARGESAVPSGIPGPGGKGGTLSSTLDLSSYGEWTGGTPGNPGGNYLGASLSDRVFVHRLELTTIEHGEDVTRIIDSPATKVVGNNSIAPVGVPGAPGNFQFSTQTQSWIHPHSLRAIIQYAKDAYLNGRIEETRALLSEYQTLLEVTRAANPPGDPADDEVFAIQANLDQIQTEIDNLVHRLESNLDYFGNPAGWVPMLSFEANFLAFQNEVNQSLPILYLTYWLNNAATNLQSSLAAVEQARSGLLAERARLETTFNEAQSIVPQLKSEAQSITFRIGQIRQDIDAKLVELEKRAQRNVADRHRVPFWKKALGTLSVVADLVPVGQPIVGRIGAGLSLLTQLDPEKPIESAKAIAPQAMGVMTNKNISVCFGTNAPPNPTNAPALTLEEKETRKEKLKRLVQCGKFLGSELKELAGVFKSAQVDSSEVAAEIEKLKASDVELQELAGETTLLNADKERFALQLSSALQTIGSFTSSLSENVIATHELEDRIASRLNVLDHGALLHIKEMEKRAHDRLLQYHYLLAKSFQYRQLKRFSGNLQLSRLLSRFQQLVEANSSHVLSAADFDVLKGVFISELRDLVSQSLDNVNAPSRSLPKSYRLNAQQRQQLNEEGQLMLNLKDLGLINRGDENVRLADLRTRVLTARATGPIGSLALLRVNYEHQGVSRLTTGGRTLLFRHYQTETSTPIAWNAIYDAQTGLMVNSTLSAAQQSLIGVLLAQQPVPVTNVVFYSLPAANADILLTKDVTSDNGTDFIIEDLLFEIQYEFTPTRSNVRELAVHVSQDLQPVISLSLADINTRQDGQGDFLRVFSPFSQVTLKAPPTYGRYTFDRWVLNSQPQPAEVATLAVAMTQDTQVEAKYRLAEGILILNPNASSPGQMTMEIPSEIGSTYLLEQKSALNGAGWGVVDSKAGTGAKLRFNRPTSNATSGFFRVRVE